MSQEEVPPATRTVDVYEKLRRQQSELPPASKESIGDLLNSSETKDVSSKHEPDAEKEEIKQYCQLKEQISQMKNRLNFIEVSKTKNKGKLESTRRRTSTFLSVRNFASELERKIEEKRQREEEEARELREKVAQLHRQQSLVLQQKKEKLRQEKQQMSERVKQEKEEIRAKLRRAEEEAQESLRETVQKRQEKRGSGSLLRMSAHPNDSISHRIRTGSTSNFKVDKPAPQKLYNVYGKKEEYGIESLVELKKELTELAQREAQKLDELHGIVEQNRKAAHRFKEITKSRAENKVTLLEEKVK